MMKIIGNWWNFAKNLKFNKNPGEIVFRLTQVREKISNRD
jgi:hypothetical protein